MGAAFAQVLKELVFKALPFVCRGSELLFQFVQLCGGEALTVGQCLAADKMFGNRTAGRLGEFKIIAEHPVVADFQLGQRLLFLCQQGVQAVLAVFHKVEELIKLFAVAAFEEPAVGNLCGRRIHKGAFQELCLVGKVIPVFEQREHRSRQAAWLLPSVARSGAFLISQDGVHGGDGGKALPERAEILGRCPVQGNPCGKPFHIVHEVE